MYFLIQGYPRTPFHFSTQEIFKKNPSNSIVFAAAGFLPPQGFGLCRVLVQRPKHKEAPQHSPGVYKQGQRIFVVEKEMCL